MVYGEDEVVTLVLVPLPISFQIMSKVNISNSKQRSAVFHVKVIVESVVVIITSGGPGWAGGEEWRVNIKHYQCGYCHSTQTQLASSRIRRHLILHLNRSKSDTEHKMHAE